MNNCQGSGSLIMKVNRNPRATDKPTNKDYFGLCEEVAAQNQPQAKSKRRRPLSRQHSQRMLKLAQSLHEAEFVGLPKAQIKNQKLKNNNRVEDNLVPRLQLDHCSSMGDLPTLAHTQSSQESSRRQLQPISPGFIRKQPPNANLLDSYRDVQLEQLQKIVVWKQNQIQLLKRKENVLRNECRQEIEKMTKETKTLRRRYEDREKSAQKMRRSLNRLEKQLQDCKERLRIRMQIVRGKEINETPKEQINNPTEKLCSSCNDLKGALQTKEKQLVRTTRLNNQYQEIICDLELANRFYKKQLDRAGVSKSPDFIEAENKMFDRQMQRRRI